jgi:hypothetical protein
MFHDVPNKAYETYFSRLAHKEMSCQIFFLKN